MSELKPKIHDKTNGLDYVLVGDYYIPLSDCRRTMNPLGTVIQS